MSKAVDTDFARIEQGFAQIVAKLEGVAEPPPIPRESDHMATPHVERHGDTWHWIVCERGKEYERKVCRSDDELLYLLTRDVVTNEGWSHELARRVEGQDSRRIAFARMIEQMGRVSPEWQARLKAELDAVLEQASYHDEEPASVAERPSRDWPAYLVVFALGLFWLAAHYPLYAAWRDSDRLDRVGISVPAVVTDRSTSYPKAGRTYTIDYAFTLSDVSYQGEQVVDRGTFERYAIGDRVSVTFDPEDPRTSRIGVAVDRVVELATYYVIIDLILLVMLVGGLRKLRRAATSSV